MNLCGSAALDFGGYVGSRPASRLFSESCKDGGKYRRERPRIGRRGALGGGMTLVFRVSALEGFND
jgi:hypothetical protein